MADIKFVIIEGNHEYTVGSELLHFPEWYQQSLDAFAILYGQWYRKLPDTVRKYLKEWLPAECLIGTEEGVWYSFEIGFMPKMFEDDADWEDERFEEVFDGFTTGILNGLESISDDPDYPEDVREKAKSLLKEYDEWEDEDEKEE